MVKLSSTNKKAQAWGIDLFIASVIFTVGIIVFYVYTINDTGDAIKETDSLFYDGKMIADSILSEGHPENWTSDNVISIGIISDNKIDETKLEKFYNLTISDYNKACAIFNTRYNYYFVLNDSLIINGETVEGIGRDPIDSKNLIKITRLTIYKEKPTTAYLYIWG